ncbi:MAG TPA: B12-binding domain-containing protein [Conexibacter sp.]|nr:B12-binding domain-containing protein [Conexibacter sp.]
MGAPPADALDDLRERCVERLIAGEAREAQALVEEALARAPAAVVYRELLTEALYEVGRRWQHGEIGVGEEHLATGICEHVLPDLAARLPRRPRCRRVAIVACAPWELHALGSRIVADFLDAGGWDVLYLGALVPASVLVELTLARRAEVVALSATTARSAAELEDVCARLQRLARPPLVAVGGQALDLDGLPPLEGTLLVRTPEALVALLAERFPLGGGAAAG